MSINQAAEFSGLQITIHDINGARWVAARDVGRALGYADPESILTIYRRHSDEFTDRDTFTVKLTVNPQGGNPNVRLFSETGVVLLTMFANTPRAKEFRAWAKRVLTGELRTSTAAAPAETRLDHIEHHLDRMASGMAELVEVSRQQAQKMELSSRYIALLELNQRGKVRVTPEIERQVFEMKAEGMANADIARLLRISPPTVGQLLKGYYPRNAELKDTQRPDLEQIIEQMVEQRRLKDGRHE